MYEEQFKNLIKNLDKIIETYDKLLILFNEKREVLKKAKSDELGTIDNQILAINDTIVKLNDKQKNLSMELLGKEGSMSDFIELSKVQSPSFEEPLMLRKVKICNNLERLVTLNNQNVELMKHGIVITNKMLETIVDAFAPQGSIYNEAGKTTDSQNLDMWTINEEI